MLILRIAVLALLGGVLSLALKKEQPAFAFLVSVGGSLALFVGIGRQMGPLLGFLHAFAGYAGGQSMRCLLQVLGIALVAQFAADTCRDAGMAAAASSVELGWRVLALLQALPLVQLLVDGFVSCL